MTNTKEISAVKIREESPLETYRQKYRPILKWIPQRQM